MALKTKKPRFKDVGGGEMNTGGAPIFADDFLTIQENSRADILNEAEYYRRRLPLLLYYQGIGNPSAPEFENGLILSGCEYDNTDPSNPVISEGFIYSGGEICYFPGGVFNTGPTATGIIYLFKGPEVPISRVFNVGGNKEILTSFSVTVEQGNIGAFGPTLQIGTAITPTDQVVAISCGVGSETLAEDYFTKEAALDLNTIGNRIKKEAFVNAGSFSAQVSFGAAMPFMVSRVLLDGSTEIRGAVQITPGGFVSTEPTLFILGSHSIATALNIGVFANYNDQGLEAPKVSVNSSGQVKLKEPSGGWGSLPTTVTLVINSIVYGINSAPSDTYEYNNDFLNITP